MNRIFRIGTIACCLLGTQVFAQNPNVIVKLDATFQYREGHNRAVDLFSYDLMGRFSTVTLETTLEPGFDLVLSERFQQIANDPDDEQLDEAYIEDRGYWKVGKQYVLFGRGVVLRESMYGGSVHLTVGDKAIPIGATYVDSGDDRQKGVVVRLGDRIGVSAAIGNRFASSGTALTVIRRPEQSPGEGHGYRKAFGVDFYLFASRPIPSRALIMSRFAQVKWPRPILDVSDLTFTYAPQRDRVLTLGLTREWKSGLNFVRLQGQYPIIDGVYLEPFLRYRNGKFHDFAISLRIKP